MAHTIRLLTFFMIFLINDTHVHAQTSPENILTIVELNVENLFDTQHDSLKNDQEWFPQADRHWTRRKYWDKLNHLGQTILSCGEYEQGHEMHWELPDLVGLCEVENDSCLRDLTKRSLLRRAEYEYVMTDSPDPRGIDVALLYSPFSFRLIRSYGLRVNPGPDMHPTRDILYACGELQNGDTLHTFIVHAPSRLGGARLTNPHRQRVVERLMETIDSIRRLSPKGKTLVMGDFNETNGGETLRILARHGLVDVSVNATGSNGARGTYKYQGKWGSLDHILVDSLWAEKLRSCRIHDALFLLEEDKKYGGVQPFRTYYGYRYQKGFSDHLPLVLTIDN